MEIDSQNEWGINWNNMIIIFWTILSTVGLLIAMWYLSSIFNPYGRINYPMILWKNIGHVISWILIIIGIASLIALYISTHSLLLFLKIFAGILAVVFMVKLKFTPLEMPFIDVMGSLYSGGGLRFGGFPTSVFLEATEPLEKKQPGIREKIIGEAHYLAFWLHKFPEIVFFLGIVFYKNLWTAFLLFIAAFIFEFIRFYLFGSSPFLSGACRFWNWIKIPTFIIASIILWPEGNFLSVTLIVFLVIQGWFSLVSTIGMLPIRLMGARFIYKKYGSPWHNMEGMAISFVINRWRLKLFPTVR